MLERRPAARNQLVVERVADSMILVAHPAPRHARGEVRDVKQRRQVQPVGFPVIHRRGDVRTERVEAPAVGAVARS